MEASFDSARLLEALSKMQVHQQVAFGAACCERMIPNYERFMRETVWGDISPLRRGLEIVWEFCDQGSTKQSDLPELLSQCEKCVPDAEDFTSLYVSSAQDAALATCALLDYLQTHDLNNIVKVPRFSTDSVDLIIQEQENMDPRDPLREQKILEHPLMQQELVRQQRDLKDASNISSGDKAGLLAFRSRAQRESNLITK